MRFVTTTQKSVFSRSWHNEGIELLDKYAQYRLLGALQEKGFFTRERPHIRISVLREELNLLAKYNRLFAGILEILERCDFVRVEQQDILVTLPKATSLKTQLLIEDYKTTFRLSDDDNVNRFCKSFIMLMSATIGGIIDVLSGKKSYLDVMFPKGSFDLVGGIYKGNVQLYINDKVAELAKQEVKRLYKEDSDRIINVLEVGAGTGMSTVRVLDQIADYGNCIKFWYTDLGKSFVRRAKRKFNSIYPFMEFKALDIDKCPVEQGFQANSIDIIICNNVVHATPSILNTLQNIYRLSSKGGFIVINDVSKRFDYNTITFGLADGWWLFGDPELRIEHSPLLSNKGMQELLENLGYTNTNIAGLPSLGIDEHGQSIVTGYKQ